MHGYITLLRNDTVCLTVFKVQWKFLFDFNLFISKSKIIANS